MVALTKSRRDLLRGALLGGILAAVGVLGFVGLLMALQWVGHATDDAAPAMRTAVLIKPLVSIAVPLGLLIGLLAARLQRRRKGVLLTLGALAYLVTSLATTFWVEPIHARMAAIVAQAGRGVWAALAFVLVAGPPLVVAYWLLERLTRPPVGKGEAAGATAVEETDTDKPAAADGAVGKPELAAAAEPNDSTSADAPDEHSTPDEPDDQGSADRPAKDGVAEPAEEPTGVDVPDEQAAADEADDGVRADESDEEGDSKAE